MCVYFKTGHPDMLVEGAGGAIGVQGGATDGNASFYEIKLVEGFKQKSFRILQYTLKHKTM